MIWRKFLQYAIVNKYFLKNKVAIKSFTVHVCNHHHSLANTVNRNIGRGSRLLSLQQL